MFGKKKQKDDVTLTANTPATDENMVVHTMQDDLAAGSGTQQVMPDPSVHDAHTPFGGQIQDPAASAPQEQSTASPFAQESADVTMQTEPVADMMATQTEAPSQVDMSSQQSTPNPFAQDAAVNTSKNFAAPQAPSYAGSAGFEQASPMDQEISSVQDVPEENIIMQEDVVPPQKSRLLSIILLILLAVVIVTVIVAGYYFFQSRNAAQDAAQDTPVTLNNAITDGFDDVSGTIIDAGDGVGGTTTDSLPDLTDNSIAPPVIDEYSEILPNYLLVDAEGDTQSIVNAKLAEIDQTLRAQQSASVIAFVVTDSSNAPIALQRYNDLTDLNLPAEVLLAIDESFMLYAYDDNGQTRFGISAAVTDVDVAANAMRASEAVLPSALAHLFNGVTVTQAVPTFSNSTYKSAAIRYANLNDTETLSIDYAIVDGMLVIGTSKDTIRAIIDKEFAAAAVEDSIGDAMGDINN